MTSDEYKNFYAQNPLTVAHLSQPESIEDFAEHHSGNLFVLGCPVGPDGWYVKMHDSWGDEEQIVVHLYDPAAETEEEMLEHDIQWLFDSLHGDEAVALFLDRDRLKAAISEKFGNTNALKGMRCPRCGNTDALIVELRARATVIDNGVDVYHDTEWEDDAGTECTRCGLTGEWRDFRATQFLTLGQFRKATEHLDDSYHITIGGPTVQELQEWQALGGAPDWLNVQIEGIPQGDPSVDEPATIILRAENTFDTRQF